MNNQANLVFILCLSAVSAAIIPLSAKYLEGPSTKTRVVGPDGSVIDAFLPGGRILLEGTGAVPLIPAAPIVLESPAVAQPADITVPVAVKSAEIVAPVLPLPSPVLPVSARVLPVSAPAVVVPAAAVAIPTPVVPVPAPSAPTPVVVGDASPAKIVGLSAQEPAVKTVSVPVEARNSENLVEESIGTTESTAEELSTQSAGAADDNSGQYVPDNAEKLFDDGSYKPEEHS